MCGEGEAKASQSDAAKVADGQEFTPLVEENLMANSEDKLQGGTFSTGLSGEPSVVAKEGEKSYNTPTKLARSEDIYESLLQI